MPTKSNILYVLLGTAVCLVIPYLILAGCSVPLLDDYVFAARHADASPFAVVAQIWDGWSGRYLATFLSAANPLVVGSNNPFSLYHIFSLCIVCIFCASIVFTPIIPFGKHLGKQRAMALGAFALLAFFALCNNVAQLFYWFSSAMAYTIPSALALLALALALRFKNSKNILLIFILSLIAAAIPGGNEITALAFTSSIAFLAYVYRSRLTYWMTFAAIVGLCFVVFAPGNEIRMGFQFSSHPWLWAFGMSLVQSLSWVVLWVPFLILASAIYIPLFGRQLATLIPSNLRFRNYLLWSVLTIFFCHIPTTLGLSSVIIDRTANALLIFFIIFWFYGLTLLLRRFNDSAMSAISFCRRPFILYPVLFAFLFLGPFRFESITSTACLDLLSGKAAHYAQIQEQRVELLSNQSYLPGKEADTSHPTCIHLPQLGSVPASLFIGEWDADPSNEFNCFYAAYYDCNAPVDVDPDSYQIDSNAATLKSLGKTYRR